jgi:Mg2+ and Co2+ transporter CorA
MNAAIHEREIAVMNLAPSPRHSSTTARSDSPSRVCLVGSRKEWPDSASCSRVAHRFDEEVRGLEALEGGNVFLRETFRLRREISTTAIDLWHVKGIVRALANGKAKLGGVDLKEEKHLDDLLAEMDSLYETVNKSNEEVKTLIELHINFKSFETNAFLKLLAVVSFLGLIPSVAGGLLGMNLLGNPWPFTLSQVAFGVAMTMATALYVFAVKGWLR